MSAYAVALSCAVAVASEREAQWIDDGDVLEEATEPTRVLSRDELDAALDAARAEATS